MVTKNLLSVATLSVLFFACGTQKSEQEATVEDNPSTESTTTATVPEENSKEVGAVGIWDKVSVRATPAEDGKWLTSVSLGETLTYLGEEDEDSKGNKYYSIRLNDGKEGWVRHEFVVPDAKPAVFVNDADIYNRPDLLTKSDKKFSSMDIIAVKQTQGDWIEVVGKRSNGKWIDKGWAKTNNVSFESVDIAMAKFAKPILAIDDENKKAEKLEEILNNVDLSSSAFVVQIKESLDEIKLNHQEEVEQPEMVEDVQEDVVEAEDADEVMEDSTEEDN